jgi:hypothetical protein
MGGTVHWIIRNYIFSLLPVIISAMIFFFVFKGLTWDMIDPGLYSFSMAVLSIGLMTQFTINNDNDKDLCTSVTMIYAVFITFFLIIFSYVTILKVQSENFVDKIITKVYEISVSTQNGQLNSIQNLISMRLDTLSSLSFVRTVPILLSLVLFGYSIAIKMKYERVE